MMSDYTQALRVLADFVDEHAEAFEGVNIHADDTSLGLFVYGNNDGTKLAEVLGGSWTIRSSGFDGRINYDREGVLGYFEATIFTSKRAAREMVGA